MHKLKKWFDENGIEYEENEDGVECVTRPENAYWCKTTHSSASWETLTLALGGDTLMNNKLVSVTVPHFE